MGLREQIAKLPKIFFGSFLVKGLSERSDNELNNF